MSNDISVVVQRLQQCVLSSGLSYVELEKKTKIAKSSIQRYVSGKTKKIPIDFIIAVAPHINTTVEYLMGWEDDLNSKSSSERSKLEEEVISDFKALSEEGQQQVIEIIKMRKKFEE